MSKRIITFLIIIVFILSCSKKSNEKKGRRNRKKENTVVYVTKPQRKRLQNYLSYSVSLKAKKDIFVFSPAEERIVKIYVKEGDYVNKGDKIAELDKEETMLHYQKTKASFNQIKSEYNRTKILYEDNMISEENFENVKAQYESLKSDYELQKKNLEDHTIRSPISGIIGRRYVEESSRVSVNKKMFRIVDDSILKANINLPEEEFKYVKQGAKVEIYKNNKENTVKGFVNEISPIIDENTGTFNVEINMSKNKDFIPGMFVNVNIITREKENALSIPTKAIINREGKKGVFVVNDKKAEFVEVTTGIEQEEDIEIISGITQTDSVIIVGQKSLQNGDPVEIVSKNVDTNNTNKKNNKEKIKKRVN